MVSQKEGDVVLVLMILLRLVLLMMHSNENHVIGPVSSFGEHSRLRPRTLHCRRNLIDHFCIRRAIHRRTNSHSMTAESSLIVPHTE